LKFHHTHGNGTKDVGRNETASGWNQLIDFFRKNHHTKIIQLSVPHRFDLHANSCVNKEVEVFNRKSRKEVKIFEHNYLQNMV
jgi:capsular polysaccharide biosynthesis protein